MFRVAGPVLGSSRVDLGRSVSRRGLRVVPPAAHKVRVADSGQHFVNARHA